MFHSSTVHLRAERQLVLACVRALRIALEFGSVGFCGEEETGEPGENLSEQGENQQETQPACDAWSENRTRVTLVASDRFHHRTTPAYSRCCCVAEYVKEMH